MNKNLLMTTYTGKFVDPLNLQPKDICLPDIAHALAMKCRFSGHTREFYSVAQHCCLAALHTKGDRAIALLHDAAEAYLFDIPGPLKDREGLFEQEAFVELKILDTILLKYLGEDRERSWEEVDHQLLVWECRYLLTNWQLMPIANELPTTQISIEPCTWQEAERTFLTFAAVLGIKD